jgi:Fe-S-cluster-containing dehydrogenase component
MPYTITNQCIGCGRCLSSCPSQAIYQDTSQYWIDSSRCSECVGVYSVPQCWAVCPTNDGCISTQAVTTVAIAPSNSSADYWEQWFNTYNHLVTRLKSSHTSDYWHSWFHSYASVLSNLNPPTPKVEAT